MTFILTTHYDTETFDKTFLFLQMFSKTSVSIFNMFKVLDSSLLFLIFNKNSRIISEGNIFKIMR